MSKTPETKVTSPGGMPLEDYAMLSAQARATQGANNQPRVNRVEAGPSQTSGASAPAPAPGQIAIATVKVEHLLSIIAHCIGAQSDLLNRLLGEDHVNLPDVAQVAATSELPEVGGQIGNLHDILDRANEQAFYLALLMDQNNDRI